MSARPAAVLAAAFLALVWPLILTGRTGPSEAADQAHAHLPAIRAFAQTWPAVDLVHYEVATTPGYHLALALVCRAVGCRPVILQLVSSLFSLGLLLVVWRSAARLTGSSRAAALVLPLLASSYFLGGAVWLTTDGAGLLFAVLAVGSACLRPPTAARHSRAGLWAAAAVLVRQVHLGAAVPVVLAALGGGPLRRLVPRVLRSGSGEAGWTTVAVVPALIAPFAVLGFFAVRWGGLVPPAYAHLHDVGPNLANLLVILTLAGGLGVFFLPAAGVPLRDLVRADRWTGLAAVAGAAVGLAIASSYDQESGRWAGPIWELARRAGSVAGRSPVFAPLCALGAAVLVRLVQAAWRSGRRRETVLLVSATIAWTAAQTMNSQAWQRYSEPVLLVLLAWFAALASPEPGALLPRRTGPVLLAVLLLGVSVWTLYRPALGWAA